MNRSCHSDRCKNVRRPFDLSSKAVDHHTNVECQPHKRKYRQNLVAHRFRDWPRAHGVPTFDERAPDDDLDRHSHRRRSRAIFTWIALPAMAVPLRPLMAASASDCVGISTKPNPRSSPVALSVMRLTLETSPKPTNRSISSSLVIVYGRFPT